MATADAESLSPSYAQNTGGVNPVLEEKWSIAHQLDLIDLCTQFEGNYYECTDVDEFFNYVASKLSSLTHRSHPHSGAEVKRLVTEVCQVRKQSLLARQIPPYHGEYEKLDMAIDGWLEIEGRRCMQQAVSDLISGYLLAFGPEESTPDFLLLPVCRNRMRMNSEHVKSKMSENGKANSVMSMRLVRRIEALDSRTAAERSGRFQGHNSIRSQEELAPLPTDKSDTESSTSFHKVHASQITGKQSSRMDLPSEPSSSSTPCGEPVVPMPIRVSRDTEPTIQTQLANTFDFEMPRSRGMNDTTPSASEESSLMHQILSDKLTSTNQSNNKASDIKTLAPDKENIADLNTGTGNLNHLAQEQSSTLAPSFNQISTGQGHDEANSQLYCGPAVKRSLLFPKPRKRGSRRRTKRRASSKAAPSSAQLPLTDEHQSETCLNLTTCQPSTPGTNETGSASAQRAKRSTSTASATRLQLPTEHGENSAHPSLSLPRGRTKPSPPHLRQNDNFGRAVGPLDSDHGPSPDTRTGSQGGASGKDGRQPRSPAIHSPGPADGKRKLGALEDAAEVIDLTVSPRRKQARREEISPGVPSATAAGRASSPNQATGCGVPRRGESSQLRGIEQRLANLERLFGL